MTDAVFQTDHAAPCGLYVHIPYCQTKCGYCDFFSVPLNGRPTRPLTKRIIAELSARLADRAEYVRTIFFGGGTPSLLPMDDLRALFETVKQCVSMDRVVEFTVEANPATVDNEKAALLAGSGVTRVSMGAQSFFPAELATLERIHSPDDIAPSVSTLRRWGIRQINLDLIFGIPGQTIETWRASLQRAIDLQPHHIACYGLTYEPGTRMTAQMQRGHVTPCDEELEAEMYLTAIDVLADAGYEQYEISNFARPGCRCEHNLIYWRNGPYIGVGPSAAGCLNGRRYKNVADINRYIRMMDAAGCTEAESEEIDREMLMTEMVMMQLRLVEGLCLEEFERRTGVNFLEFAGEETADPSAAGLIRVSETHVALTRSGRLVADAVVRRIASIPTPAMAHT